MSGRREAAWVRSRGIEAVAKGEAAAGRGLPRFSRAVALAAGPTARRARRGRCRAGRCPWPPRRVPPGGGFGALAGGVPIQGAPALLGRRGGNLLPAAVTMAALDRFDPLMLKPFVEPEHLEEGFGHAANGW